MRIWLIIIAISMRNLILGEDLTVFERGRTAPRIDIRLMEEADGNPVYLSHCHRVGSRHIAPSCRNKDAGSAQPPKVEG